MEEELSQEEIKKRYELMKKNCIFCKIAKREIDSKIIFEDDISMAILDINPVSQGHLLLFPKEHYMIMPMVPDEVLGHLSVISKYLSELLIKSFDAKDITIYIANGAAAGQQSQHFMMHIIPRYDDDGIDFNLESNEKKLDEEELLELKDKLQKAIEDFKI